MLQLEAIKSCPDGDKLFMPQCAHTQARYTVGVCVGVWVGGCVCGGVGA